MLFQQFWYTKSTTKTHTQTLTSKEPSSIQQGIIHMSFVLTRLFKSAEEYWKFLSCKQEKMLC